MFTRKYGWRPDFSDQRDIKYKITREVKLPDKIDLRPSMPPVWEQGSIGSCTGHSTAAQCWFVDKTDPKEPSRLFIYYNTRKIEKTIKEDAGASIRNSIKSVVRYGFATEILWPYNIEKFKIKPSKEAYSNAITQKITEYARVHQNEYSICSALAEGLPVNFGFCVYESFESCNNVNPMLKIPGKTEILLGGHAVLLAGYDRKEKMYIVRNSWGQAWGDQGYFYIPFDYVHNKTFADDFWIIKAVP